MFLPPETPSVKTTEVTAQLLLAKADSARLRDFLIKRIGVDPSKVARRFHVTVYECRRPMPGLKSFQEPARIIIPVADTRFMVMAPGGENPRPDLDPATRKVGVRIHRQSPALKDIHHIRKRLLNYETDEVLGRRPPSTLKRSAFGARYYQAHMTLIHAGSGIDRNLSKMGKLFRAELGTLTLDKLIVNIVTTIGQPS